ncbi:MAG TPA: hypothetical protein VF170_00365, partial [Planctomycetaceae bacterium]
MNAFRPLPIASALVVALLGCSEEPEPAPPKEDAPVVVPTGPPAPAPVDDRALLRRPKLPDDVFFDDPLAIVANRTRVPGVAVPESRPASPTESAPADTEPSPEPQAVDWASLLPADLLVVEVNRIRERFAPKLQSVASFNNSLLDFPPYAAELAALGGIATEHPGNVPWKQNAKYVRDLAAEMLADQLQRGQKSYEQVKGPFDKIATLLDGKRPEGLPEADDATDFATAADFGYLMRRFEAGQNAMKTTGGSEAAFK